MTWKDVWDEADETERGMFVVLLPAWPFIIVTFWLFKQLGRFATWLTENA